MIKKIFFLLFISMNLFSVTINSTYYVESQNIKLSTLVSDANYDVTLYKFDKNRNTKRVRTKDLVELLKKHDIEAESSSRYINFIKKSQINISRIEKKIFDTYKEKYPTIKINSIAVIPRGYIKSLPLKYDINIKEKTLLSNKGTINIRTIEKKKIFFNYFIDAKIDVYISRTVIKKGLKISNLNAIKNTITFNKFKALPIGYNSINNSQTKRHFKKNAVITFRDIESMNLVKRGNSVNVLLQNKNINISFLAKALRNGKLNDIITVQKTSGKKMQAKVIGKNRVEIR